MGDYCLVLSRKAKFTVCFGTFVIRMSGGACFLWRAQEVCQASGTIRPPCSEPVLWEQQGSSYKTMGSQAHVVATLGYKL